MSKVSILIPARLFIFRVISLSSFASFFKPVFSLGPLHTFFVSNGITDSAKGSSSFFSAINIVFRKWMSVLTMSLSGIFSCNSISSKYVYFIGNKLKVFWVTTGMIATKMVNSPFLSSWNGFYKQFISNSMYPFSFSVNTYHSISILIQRSLPVPTSSFIRDNNSFTHIYYYTTK